MKDKITKYGTHNGGFCVNSMACRLLVCIILAFASAGALFAQEAAKAAEASGPKKNAITLDLVPLVRGIAEGDDDGNNSFFCVALAYERQIAPHFSIGGELDLYPGKTGGESYMYFGMAFAGRYYVMSEQMEKFFLGTSLGFNVQSVDGKTKPKDGGFSGLLLSVKAGYRVLFGNTFFMEPSVMYTVAESNGDFSFGGISYSISSPIPGGWQGGLRIGIQF